MHMRLALIVAGICALGVSACADETVRPLEIEAKSIPLATGEETPTSIGKLHHLGTLRLKSPDADFGGISGLIVSPDGKDFLAITDSSHWLTGELVYRGHKLTGAKGISIAPILDTNGRPLSGKGGDAEGLTGTLDGDVYISFERDHRIWRYDFGRQGLKARAVNVPVPAELADAPTNGGLEALTLLPDGRLLAITESFHDDNGNIRGWLIGGKSGEGGEALALKRRAPFDLTDIRFLPDGDILTLERRFNRTGGIGFEMRRIKGSSLKPGALLDGEVLADAGMNFIIDNMEGMSIRKDDAGKTLVYLASDDNFNPPLQQNLLMLFELRD